MAKKNFYAVKVGIKIGIFKTWAECSKYVAGYPNAKFKGFATYEEAENYLKETSVKTKKEKEKIETVNQSEDDNKSYYVVRKGLKPGLYNSWPECKEQVDGYSGAEYKKVVGRIAALIYLDPSIVVKKEKAKKKSKIASQSTKDKDVKVGYDVKPIKSRADVKSSEIFINPGDIRNEYEFIAFVDGSYDKVTKTYGSGVIVLNTDNTYNTYSKSGYDEWDQWNIVGELEATKLALTKAQEFGVKNVAIYHDLKNISLWATGEWRAKNKYTQEYVQFIETISRSLNIYFIKVKGHSDESGYNDLADEVAKKAIFEYK